jgi:selenide,water dikinase
MPIVDDPFDFGRIASANAISDVYAMGGKPVLAIAILGWPVDKLPPEAAQRVLEGARTICAQAGISLAGGHSIDCPEPVFGLAVNGLVDTHRVKRNSSAEAGCLLYLTKALGVGILSTAQKKGLLADEDAALALQSMVALNKTGEILGQIPGVKAMTDVTGFGLLGHLVEMCEGSGVSAIIDAAKIPTIASVHRYLQLGCIPGGTIRNWNSYGNKVKLASPEQRHLLADPQTSGGLLVAVTPGSAAEVEQLLRDQGLPGASCRPFGSLVGQTDLTVEVIG